MRRRKHRTPPQLIASSTVTLPDNKPDIEFLLRITLAPVIEHCLTAPGQLRITGYVRLAAEYVAASADNTQPVTSAEFVLPFDEALAHSQSAPNRRAWLKTVAALKHIRLTAPRELAFDWQLQLAAVKLTCLSASLPPHQCRPCCVDIYQADK